MKVKEIRPEIFRHDSEISIKEQPFFKPKLIHDNFQNYKRYGIPRAQLVIADIPYNIGGKAYGSNPMWYIGGDNRNGESKHAKSTFFNGDGDFNLNEFFHFCAKLLKPEPKARGKAPCMILFCSFEQIPMVIEIAKKHGYLHYIPLIFCKNYSAQVLKANMRICGATEYALILYRNKLPKFNNKDADGAKHMIFNWFEWKRDNPKIYPKIHPTQKPVNVLKRLIEIFSDPSDVIIDPCAGSGTTLRAAAELGRKSFGFEVSTRFYNDAAEKMLQPLVKGTAKEEA